MSGSPYRRATLLDLMILVAATASALVITREFFRHRLVLPPPYSLDLVLDALVPTLATWSLAVVVLRLRLPRQKLRRAFRGPGAVACGAAVAALGLECAVVVPLFLVKGPPFAEDFHQMGQAHLLPPVGAAVAGAWSMLVLGRRWRPERDWIDRLGRVVGSGWILAFLVAVGIGAWNIVRWNGSPPP